MTFDDGYADNATVALPILREAGVHATFFVATSYLDGGRMWNDTVIEAVRAARGPGLDLAAAGLGEHAIATVAERRATIDRLLATLKYAEPERREGLAGAVASVAGVALPDDLM
ncbi:MAG TPA: polysaccharide deacetylase family protein, partial [Candidatus Tumulicola sp.]|nr:polysaccharide deacetylase family protein [Candidatus Tumulicola sp.]